MQQVALTTRTESAPSNQHEMMQHQIILASNNVVAARQQTHSRKNN